MLLIQQLGDNVTSTNYATMVISIWCPDTQHTHPHQSTNSILLQLAPTCYPFCPNNLYHVGWDQSWTVITVLLHFLNCDNKRSYKNRDCHTVCLFQCIRIMTSPTAPAASQSIPLFPNNLYNVRWDQSMLNFSLTLLDVAQATIWHICKWICWTLLHIW